LSLSELSDHGLLKFLEPKKSVGLAAAGAAGVSHGDGKKSGTLAGAAPKPPEAEAKPGPDGLPVVGHGLVLGCCDEAKSEANGLYVRFDGFEAGLAGWNGSGSLRTGLDESSTLVLKMLSISLRAAYLSSCCADMIGFVGSGTGWTGAATGAAGTAGNGARPKLI